MSALHKVLEEWFKIYCDPRLTPDLIVLLLMLLLLLTPGTNIILK